MKKKRESINKTDIEFIIVIVVIITSVVFIKFFDFDKEGQQYLFLGDSITSKYELQKYYSNYPVINSSIGGNRTIDILENLDNRVYKYNPDKVIILIGINDLANNQSTDYVFENIRKISYDIQKKFPKCKIYIQSIYPVNSEWKKQAPDYSPSLEEILKRINEVNNKLKDYCKKNKYKYIDAYSVLANNDGSLKDLYTIDGIHLSDEGYKIITYTIKKEIID